VTLLLDRGLDSSGGTGFVRERLALLAKTLFLAGDAARALDEADLAGIPTVLVTSAGDVLLAGGLR